MALTAPADTGGPRDSVGVAGRVPRRHLLRLMSGR